MSPTEVSTLVVLVSTPFALVMTFQWFDVDHSRSPFCEHINKCESSTDGHYSLDSVLFHVRCHLSTPVMSLEFHHCSTCFLI